MHAANVSQIQITDYVRALNSIGFYHWSMKWQLHRAIPPANLGPDAVVPVLPFATDGMSYSDICVLYKHIGLLKGGNFTCAVLIGGRVLSGARLPRARCCAFVAQLLPLKRAAASTR